MDSYTSVLCGHRMSFGGPAGSDRLQGRIEGESQGNPCCQRDLMMTTTTTTVVLLLFGISFFG